MTTKKPTKNTPTPTPSSSATGRQLDPKDGRPIFADGMSLSRWRKATRPARKQAIVDELRTPDPDHAE